ncbi:hypothetical protein M404DRAFT_1008710, partial [Pisolithus tinctorius Marx 270]
WIGSWNKGTRASESSVEVDGTPLSSQGQVYLRVCRSTFVGERVTLICIYSGADVQLSHRIYIDFTNFKLGCKYLT